MSAIVERLRELAKFPNIHFHYKDGHQAVIDAADRIEELERRIDNHLKIAMNTGKYQREEARTKALEEAAKVVEAELAKYDCMNENALARGWHTVSVEAKSKIAVLAPLAAAIRALIPSPPKSE